MREILKGTIVEAPKFGELNIVEDGCLVLEDGVIEGIYPEIPENSYDAVIHDYGKSMILQSFCDMHMHAPQYSMIAVGFELPLIEWLETYTFKFEAAYQDTDYARRAYRRLAHDLVINGTTHVCLFSTLHVEATWILMEELEKAGICGYVGKVNMDRNAMPGILQETTEESVRETIRWLDGCHFEHIHPMLTPRFTPACTDELMAELGKIAKERGLYVQSHLSENKKEIAWVHELHPDTQRYYESYEKYGLFKEKTIMAHCVHSDAIERQAMKDNGVVVAHCPDSNVDLSSGICPVRKMLNEGVQVVLGSDIAGGALLPMYEVAASAIRTSKFQSFKDPEDQFLSVAEAYYLATSAGQKYFGMGEGFQKGDRLHAIVVDDSSFPETPMDFPSKIRFERMMYLMKPENIISVWSEGRDILK